MYLLGFAIEHFVVFGGQVLRRAQGLVRTESLCMITEMPQAEDSVDIHAREHIQKLRARSSVLRGRTG
jgi:hypothetical protein